MIGRPVATLTVDSGSGLAAAAASALAGPGSLDLAQAAVHCLAVHLGVGREHDRLEISLSKMSPLADVDPGTRLQVAVGLEDDTVDVLAADVFRIDRRPERTDIVALAPSHRLSSTAFARTYRGVSVGDVVRDILDEVDVEAGDIDASGDVHTYYVDGRLTAWENLRRLATRVGALMTSGPNGALNFIPAPGAEPTGGLGALTASDELRPGADLIDWQLGPRRSRPRQPADVVSIGGASALGSSRAHHLIKEPDSGAGPTMVDAAFRDGDGADRMASAATAAANRAVGGGRLDVVGDPSLRAGSLVDSDGTSWHVVRAAHRIDRHRGYQCGLVVEAIS